MNRTIHAATAIIVRYGLILICQRKLDDSFGGYWEFPGGGQEVGETLHECLHRELQEELSLDVKILHGLTPVTHVITEGKLVLNPFLCEMLGSEPVAIECEQFRWIEPHELSSYRFPPNNESLFREIVAVLGDHRSGDVIG